MVLWAKRTLEWIVWPSLGIAVPTLMALFIFVSWITCLVLDELAVSLKKLLGRMDPAHASAAAHRSGTATRPQ